LTSGDYRAKAAELWAKASHESNPEVQAELEGLAAAYLRLAEQADRNQQLDLSYETPPSKTDDPDVAP
jgi:hypothetical protein